MSYAKIIMGVIGGFAGGLISGVLISRKAIRNEYEKEYNERFEQLQNYYTEHPEYLRSIKEYQGEEEADIPEDWKPAKYDSKEDTGTTDYAAMYPLQVQEKTSPEEEESIEKQITDQYNEEDKYKEPEILSEEEGRNLPRHINSETLYYYIMDDVFTDDYGNIIEEPEYLIGKNIEYLRGRPDNSITYIMNYLQTICYEVQVFETNPDS